jgi:hypothetical protein
VTTRESKSAPLLIYKIAKKAIWLGTVEALDKQAAVEKAAQEFKPRYGACMRWRGDDAATDGDLTHGDSGRKGAGPREQ